MSLLEQYEASLAAPAPTSESTLLAEVEASMQSGIHEEVYAEYLSKNRPHQNDALTAIATAPKGQVIVPTGTGKTRIQVALLAGDMIQKFNQNQQGVYVIASHRLLLNKQLMDECRDILLKVGLPVNVLYIGSARQDEKAVYDKYFSHGVTTETYEETYTTSGSEARAFCNRTLQAGRSLVVVSTYHSFDALEALDSINICTFDEAHNTTEAGFNETIKRVLPKVKRSYFFTATRKVCTISGHGMENEEVYGEVLCDVGPREMIEAGEIVRPRIIAMMLDEDVPKGVVSDKNQHMLVKTIQEAFTKNQAEIKSKSVTPDAIGTKLLVSFVGSDELARVQESEEFKEWCTTNHIRVFSFSSAYGARDSETQGSETETTGLDLEVNRNKVYEDMRGLSDSENCILLHIDILAEGIDLPSITGVLLLRHLNEVKLFQTLGRALRLMKADRQKLYAGEISPEDRTKWVKPFAYLILPMHFMGMEGSCEDMKATIQKVIQTYGIPVEEFLPPEGFKARDIKVLGPLTDSRKISKVKKDYPLLLVVEDFVMEQFIAELPGDPQAKYEAMMKVLTDNEGNVDA